MAGLLPMGFLQFLDADGNPLAGGTVGYYDPAAPAVLKNVWADSAQTILLANPVPLDAAGKPFSGGSNVGIWGTGEYLMLVKDLNGVLQWSALTVEPFSDTGGTINGNVTINGTLTVANVTVSANAAVNGTLTPQNINLITGNGQLNNLTVNTLGVTGNVTVGGTVTSTGAMFAPAFNVVSDRRRKVILDDRLTTDFLATVMAIPIHAGHLTEEDASAARPLVIADELQRFVPSAVNGAPDAVSPNGLPIYQTVNSWDMVVMLLGAIQQLYQRLQQVESNLAVR